MAKDSKVSPYLGSFYLFFGMAVFGSATPISKIVGSEMPILSASLLRVILAALVLLPFVIKNLTQELKKIDAKGWFHIALIAAFGMVGFTVFLIWGMKSVSGVVGSLIMSLAPALTGLASYYFLDAPLGKKRILALLLGLGGLVIMSIFGKKFGFEHSAAAYLGAGLVFLAICCEAVYTVFGKKVTDSVPPLLVTFLATLLSIPLFLFLAILNVDTWDWSAISTRTWYSLAWWGAGTLGLGSALWYCGLARAEGSTAAGFMSVMPMSALLLSYFLLGESFHAVHLLGFAFVLGSVGLMSWVHVHGD